MAILELIPVRYEVGYIILWSCEFFVLKAIFYKIGMRKLKASKVLFFKLSW